MNEVLNFDLKFWSKAFKKIWRLNSVKCEASLITANMPRSGVTILSPEPLTEMFIVPRDPIRGSPRINFGILTICYIYK